MYYQYQVTLAAKLCLFSILAVSCPNDQLYKSSDKYSNHSNSPSSSHSSTRLGSIAAYHSPCRDSGPVQMAQSRDIYDKIADPLRISTSTSTFFRNQTTFPPANLRSFQQDWVHPSKSPYHKSTINPTKLRATHLKLITSGGKKKPTS